MKVGEAVWVFEPNTSLLQRLQATFGKGSCLLVGRQLFVLEPWQFLFCKTYMAICTIYCLHDKLVCVSLMCIQYYVALFRSSSSYLCLCHSCIRICTTSFFVSSTAILAQGYWGLCPRLPWAVVTHFVWLNYREDCLILFRNRGVWSFSLVCA